MKLTVLGSESAGNCYVLESQDEVLVMEAGLRLRVLKDALNYNLSNVVGCIVSHQHGDHFKYHKDYAKAGITIYASEDCWLSSDYSGHRSAIITAGCLYRIGEFRVIPFAVPHSVKCFGFLIKHPGMGTLLFVTDAAYVVNRFVGLNHILIEANYEDSILTNDRAVGSHMSLDTTMKFLRANDLAHCYNIVLLHLSSSNSDAAQFERSVKKIAPNAAVHIADKGLSIELINNPF